MIKAPTNCPSCDSVLIREKDQLFCINKDCEAQSLKKIEHFAKTMKIKGLGEKTIQKLELETLEDIYSLTEEDLVNIIGQSLGSKLFIEIEQSKSNPLDQVIASFSIPSIGEGSAQKLTTNKINFWELTHDQCRSCGLGEVATTKLIDWLGKNKNYKDLPLNFISTTRESTNIPSKGVVCITGKLNDFKNRKDAKEYLESNGYKVVDSVTEKVNYLVNEAGEKSSKTDKAAKYGIQTVTIKQLTEC